MGDIDTAEFMDGFINDNNSKVEAFAIAFKFKTPQALTEAQREAVRDFIAEQFRKLDKDAALFPQQMDLPSPEQFSVQQLTDPAKRELFGML